MSPSVQQLLKILKNEADHHHANNSVIGGLPKMLKFWVPNARRDGLSEAFISTVEDRLNVYPDLDVPQRQAVLAELTGLAKKQTANAQAPRPPRPADAAPRPERPPRPAEAPRSPNAASGQPPRPERPPRAERPPRPAEGPRNTEGAPRPEGGKGQRPRNAEAPRPPEGLRNAERPRSAEDKRPTRPERPPRPVEAPPPSEADLLPFEAAPTSPPPEAPPLEPLPVRRTEVNYAGLDVVNPRPRRASAPTPVRAETPVQTGVGLEAPLTVLRGIGSERAALFEKLGLTTLRDLLFYFPRRYDDYSRLKTINRLEYGEDCTLIATIWEARERPIRGGQAKMLQVVLSDATGLLEVSFFNQPWLARQLTAGKQIVISGRVDQYLGRLTLKTSEWEELDRDLLHTGRIVPVYGLTEGLKNKMVRQATAQVVKFWAERLPDPLPEAMRQRHDLMPYGEALAQMHYPDSEAKLNAAKHRLAFDELLALQVGVLRQRAQFRAEPGTPRTVSEAWLIDVLDNLPYRPTRAQQRAFDVIRADVAQPVPMNRLLQGDVGSGKTLVAAVSMALVAHAGGQAALMAPTSILAEQHYKTLLRLLAGMGGEPAPWHWPESAVRLLHGATPAKEKAEIYAGLLSGDIKFVVGTHALIEDPVGFADLGLVVVDEQHRFGVLQRAQLRAKGGNPHVLVMTATPIPRSLALTVFGDLDVTVLDELPPGRQPITTYALHANERARAYDFIRREVGKGRQAFIIFPLVEESDKLEAKAAVDEHARLQTREFADLQLGLLHGRMKPSEKDEVMLKFRAGDYHILVSTSVVEVGVDVPNASVILIDGANRFGLAQLHQFRGRVGRGAHASYCLLVSDAPNADTDARLKVMEETQDGFVLAEKDLQLRGPGDFLGTRQSGFSEFDLARLSDMRTIEKARTEAQTLFATDPHLHDPAHHAIADLVRQFFKPGVGDVS